MEPQIGAYRVKVEIGAPTTYLWGSKSVNSKNAVLKSDTSRLFLHFRNSEDGEVVVVSTIANDNKPAEELGSFQPGESFTLSLQNIIGVNATVKSPLHSYVDCAILTAH